METNLVRKMHDTRIFSPLLVPRLCATIGHQLNEFDGLSSLRSPSFPD
jgi:hypothetical protein